MKAVHFGEIRLFKKEHPGHDVLGQVLDTTADMKAGSAVILRTENIPLPEDMHPLRETVPYVLLTGPDKDQFMSGEHEDALMDKIAMAIRALNIQA